MLTSWLYKAARQCAEETSVCLEAADITSRAAQCRASWPHPQLARPSGSHHEASSRTSARDRRCGCWGVKKERRKNQGGGRGEGGAHLQAALPGPAPGPEGLVVLLLAQLRLQAPGRGGGTNTLGQLWLHPPEASNRARPFRQLAAGTSGETAPTAIPGGERPPSTGDKWQPGVLKPLCPRPLPHPSHALHPAAHCSHALLPCPAPGPCSQQFAHRCRHHCHAACRPARRRSP